MHNGDASNGCITFCVSAVTTILGNMMLGGNMIPGNTVVG